MFIGTIDFNHFIPVTLTLSGGHKVNAKQNQLAWFSCTLFNWSGWNVICCWTSSSWTPWCCFEWDLMNLLFYWLCQTFLCWHALWCLWIDLVQTWYGDKYYWALHFASSLTDLDSDSRQLLRQLSHKVSNLYGCDVICCWTWWLDEPHTFWSCPFST